MPKHASGEIVVFDTRPSRAVHVLPIALGGLLFVPWTIQGLLIGLPLLLALVALLVMPVRASSNAPVASSEGISRLRVRVPWDERRSWLRRYAVIQATTPWDQIDSVRVGATALSLSRIRVRLTDGREAVLPASAVTARGLRKIANDVERLRLAAA
jgi:hypothetical protein